MEATGAALHPWLDGQVHEDRIDRQQGCGDGSVLVLPPKPLNGPPQPLITTEASPCQCSDSAIAPELRTATRTDPVLRRVLDQGRHLPAVAPVPNPIWL